MEPSYFYFACSHLPYGVNPTENQIAFQREDTPNQNGPAQVHWGKWIKLWTSVEFRLMLEEYEPSSVEKLFVLYHKKY